MKEKSLTTKDWQRAVQTEVDAAFLYRVLAELEQNTDVARVYDRLSEIELGHAEATRQHLAEKGHGIAPSQPSGRARVLAWLARRLGAQVILSTMIELEQGLATTQQRAKQQTGMRVTGREDVHARVLAAIHDRFPAGAEGETLARLEGRHRNVVGGNALRAAVLGANDGLLSNLSLVMGVAGASVDSRGILITGLAGLLAGASSMALGEWLSVQSSRELYQRQIAIEAAELETAPQEEAAELALIYQAKGIPADHATKLAQRLIENEEAALDTLVREELAIDPQQLGGSAWEAALTSFILFAVGAMIPVVPFLWLTGQAAVGTSLAISSAGLFGIGAAITLLTGRSIVYSGMRQLVFGLIAAGMTFGIGHLLGVAIAG